MDNLITDMFLKNINQYWNSNLKKVSLHIIRLDNMQRHVKILFLIIPVLVSVFCPLPLYAVYFKNIGLREGLSQLSVVSIHQDVLGRMWFGTLEGLSIYDGHQMTTFKGGNDVFDRYIKGNEIRNISENAAHDIFFMADDALIEYQFERNRLARIRERGVTSVSSVRGRIYVSVKDSVLVWDERRRELLPFLKAGGPIGNIHSVFMDSFSNWWVASRTGLYKKHGGEWLCVIAGTPVWSIYESRSKELWVSTNSGLYVIGRKGETKCFMADKESPGSLSSNRVRNVTEDAEGNFWIGTFNGLNKFSPENGRFEVYKEGILPGNLKHSSVHSIMTDNQGNIWVGTYYGGVSVFNPSRQLYSYYPVGIGGLGHLDFHLVGQLVEDNRHSIWLCTDGGGLNFLDRESGRFRALNMANSPIRSNNLKSICYDAESERLFIALYSQGLCSYDIRNGKFMNLLDRTGGDRNVLKLAIWNGQLLYLSARGVFRMDLKSGNVVPVLEQSGCQIFLMDSRNILWAVHGYEVIRMDSSGNLQRANLKEYGLGNGIPLCIGEGNDGNIYIGTMGGGVVECDSALHRIDIHTHVRNGLLDDYCYAVAVSKCGRLLLLNSRGLSFFNTRTKKVEDVIMAENLPVAGFNDGNGLLVTENGDIFAGSTDGLIMFPEKSIHMKHPEFPLFFSGLAVNDVQVKPGDRTGILKKAIYYTDRLSLSSEQNNLAFTFACNNFGNDIYMSPHYEYRLDGLDERWMAVDKSGSLSYTNLNPGDYVLRLREKNPFDGSTVQEIRMALTIRQPFYNTPWAWMLYILSASALLYIILSAKWRQMVLKRTLENEKLEKERIEEMDKFKFNFFTNVSHELRTPLMLIITQAELLLRNKGLASAFRGGIDRLYQNARYMSNLINELLDFHKLEQKQLRLKVSRYDIVPFLGGIFDLFKERASVQNIRYNFVVHGGEQFCWFDPVQLRKVFFNLLSNAFKYTGQGGTVEVAVSGEEKNVVVRVTDSGSGIAKEDMRKIFDRFYQVPSGRRIVGTGIGLALSKEIMELHHGEISVESKVGYGSVFTVRLNKECDSLCDDPMIDLVDSSENEEGMRTDGNNTLYSASGKDAVGDKQYTEDIIRELRDEQGGGAADYSILIVEDEPDLRKMLGEIFSGLYRVLEAFNGKEGWMTAQNELPDIVLSDVMMPEMDGLEMCRKIKNTERTKHIPVILLTAAGSTEQQMDGLRTGADDYLTKPFDMELLLLKVGAILRSRIILKNMLVKGNLDASVPAVKDEAENRWLRKVEEIVSAHIGDEDFTVDKLADELRQSRSYVFKRMKTLKGITPADFILGERLKKGAALLLDDAEIQVEEVAFRIGFSSGRYFSKVFKEYFNMSPSQYRKSYGAGGHVILTK